jgi:hypothetical protein
MMKKLSQQDVNKLIRRSLTKVVLEKLTVKVGKEVVVSPDLKIRHVGNNKVEGSKYLYTVTGIDNVDGVLQMKLKYYDDETPEPIETTVTQDEFDQYELA